MSTTSRPSAASTGQLLPNGPRTPIAAPSVSPRMALVTAPTSRVVCTSVSGRSGSPLIEMGTSPTPNT